MRNTEMLRTKSRRMRELQSPRLDQRTRDSARETGEPARARLARTTNAKFLSLASYLNSQNRLEQKPEDQRQNEEQPNPIPFHPGKRNRTFRIIHLDGPNSPVGRQRWFGGDENPLPPAVLQPNRRNAPDSA